MKFDKKAIRSTEIFKKQANFNQNKLKNKQHASLKKKRKSTKKQAQIRGKTARLATLTTVTWTGHLRKFVAILLLRNKGQQ